METRHPQCRQQVRNESVYCAGMHLRNAIRDESFRLTFFLLEILRYQLTFSRQNFSIEITSVGIQNNFLQILRIRISTSDELVFAVELLRVIYIKSARLHGDIPFRETAAEFDSSPSWYAFICIRTCIHMYLCRRLVIQKYGSITSRGLLLNNRLVASRCTVAGPMVSLNRPRGSPVHVPG